MSALKNNLGLGLATVALVFSTAAAANPFGNGQFVPNVIDSIKVAAPADRDVESRARGFLNSLKEALPSMGEKPQIVDYPPRANRELLRITAVVPPKGMEDQAIPVCAEQNNKVLGTWNITPRGEVMSVTGNWAKETDTHTACKDFIVAARADITRLAQARGISPRVEAAPAPVPGKVSMLP